MNRLSYVSKPDKHHRKPWIIWDGMWIFAEFETEEQLQAFSKTLGFQYDPKPGEERPYNGGIYREYTIDKVINDDKGFFNLEELPEGATPIQALSNGYLVTCYFKTYDDRIDFYRPNPNAKEVYKPMPTQAHIAHQMLYGSY